jgi:hypothetical protein
MAKKIKTMAKVALIGRVLKNLKAPPTDERVTHEKF